MEYDPDQLPLTISAPGHQTAHLVEPRDEIALEPDVTFTLSGDALSHRIERITIESLPPDQVASYHPHLLTCGFINEQQWAIALSYAVFRTRLLRPDLLIDFWLADKSKLTIRLIPSPGLRATYFIDQAASTTTSDLAIELTSPATAKGRPPAVSCRLLARSTTPEVLRRFAWGSAQWLEADVDLHLSQQGFKIGFPDIPLGVQCQLRARNDITGGFALETFIHDGTVHRFRLRQGISVSGRLVTPAPLRDSTIPVYLLLELRRERPSQTRGNEIQVAESMVSLQNAQDFTIVGPEVVPIVDWPTTGWYANLRISAPGCRTEQVSRDTCSGLIDAGTIQLRYLEPAFVLEANAALTPTSLRQGRLIVIDAGRERWFAVMGARNLGRNRLGVYLDDKDASSLPLQSVPRQALLQCPGVRGTIPLIESSPPGTLHPVPRRRYRGKIAPGGGRDKTRLVLGWKWNGLSAPIRELGQLIEEVQIAFDAPVEGVQLWWMKFKYEDGKKVAGPVHYLDLHGEDFELLIE